MAEERNYTLRDLKSDDIFLVVGIINKIGIKEMKSCFESQDVRKAISGAAGGEEADLSSVGVTVMLEIASLILAHLPDCKKEIYALLAELSGMNQAEIAELPFRTFVRMVKDVIRKDEFKDFFQDAFGSQD